MLVRVVTRVLLLAALCGACACAVLSGSSWQGVGGNGHNGGSLDATDATALHLYRPLVTYARKVLSTTFTPLCGNASAVSPGVCDPTRYSGVSSTSFFNTGYLAIGDALASFHSRSSGPPPSATYFNSGTELFPPLVLANGSFIFCNGTTVEGTDFDVSVRGRARFYTNPVVSESGVMVTFSTTSRLWLPETLPTGTITITAYNVSTGARLSRVTLVDTIPAPSSLYSRPAISDDGATVTLFAMRINSGHLLPELMQYSTDRGVMQWTAAVDNCSATSPVFLGYQDASVGAIVQHNRALFINCRCNYLGGSAPSGLSAYDSASGKRLWSVNGIEGYAGSNVPGLALVQDHLAYVYGASSDRGLIAHLGLVDTATGVLSFATPLNASYTAQGVAPVIDTHKDGTATAYVTLASSTHTTVFAVNVDLASKSANVLWEFELLHDVSGVSDAPVGPSALQMAGGGAKKGRLYATFGASYASLEPDTSKPLQ
eukprot:TRINITY_DN11798_c0_g1_i1.p1 TRINITY_DN11798_c0_g1~~TRINITY_DN11798_c0_g1_i1.p1  ORF type:complete len:487 (+),score=87.87 TRINITY_DN11798_c0_g1_i1:40-1500(+)